MNSRTTTTPTQLRGCDKREPRSQVTVRDHQQERAVRLVQRTGVVPRLLEACSDSIIYMTLSSGTRWCMGCREIILEALIS